MHVYNVDIVQGTNPYLWLHKRAGEESRGGCALWESYPGKITFDCLVVAKRMLLMPDGLESKSWL